MDFFGDYDIGQLANELFVNNNDFSAIDSIYNSETMSLADYQNSQKIVNDAIQQNLLLSNSPPKDIEGVDVVVIGRVDFDFDFTDDDTIVIPHNIGGLDGLLNEFASRGLENISSLNVIGHAGNAAFVLGGVTYNLGNLSESQPWNELGDYLSYGAELNLYGCSIAYDNRGVGFLSNLSEYIDNGKLEINASIDLSGKLNDWTLEAHSVFEDGQNPEFRIYDEGKDTFTIGRDFNVEKQVFDFYQKIEVSYKEESNSYDLSVRYQLDPYFSGVTYNSYDFNLENIAGESSPARWVITELIEGNLGSWQFSYQTDESSASFGQLLSEENHLTGEWQVYNYNNAGLVEQVISSYQGSDISDIADLDLHRVTVINRDYLYDNEGNAIGFEESISLSIAGIEFHQEKLKVSEDIITISYNNGVEEVVVRRYDFVDSLTNGIDWSNYQRIDHKDGTTSVFSRENNGEEGYVITETRGQWSQEQQVIVKGTHIVRSYDANDLLQTVENFDVLTGYAVGNQITAHTYNANNFVERIDYSDGTYDSFFYVDGRLDTYIQRNGETIIYIYDENGRLISQKVGTQTSYTSYDVLGRVIAQGLTNSDGEQLLENSYRHSADNEIKLLRDALGNQESIHRSYNEDTGYYTEVIENSDGGQIIRSYYSDGLLYELTGTAIALEETHSYSLIEENEQSFVVQRIDYADGTATEITTDQFYNVVKTTRYTDSSEETIINEYDQYNRLIVQTSTTGLKTLYAYDYLGRILQEALDLNNNGLVDLTIDRIVEYDYSLEKDSSGSVFLATNTFAYLEDDSSEKTLISKQVEELYSTDATWTSQTFNQDDTLIEEIQQEFIVGGYTINKTSVDGSSEKSIYQNGQLDSLELYDSRGELVNTVNYEYDSFARLIALSDTQGYSEKYILNDNSDIVFSVRSDISGNEISEYKFYDFMGRLIENYDSLGNSSLYEYNQAGQLIEVLGTAQYRQVFTYEYDKLISRTTYNAAGTSLTRYEYDGDNIIQREYANGSILSYEYNNLGQLVEFVNANGISSYYEYNLLGQLVDESYSDDTIGIQWTYNRLGEISSITDASGTRTYNAQGDVEYTQGLLAGVNIDQHYNDLEQFTGYTLVVGDNFSSEFSVNSTDEIITYNFSGEELSLSIDGNSRELSHENFNISYNYTSLGLLEDITLNDLIQIEYDYDSNGRISHKIDHANNLSWSYVYDSKGQLISSTYTDSTGEEYSESFSYDDLGNRLEQSNEALVVEEYSQELNALFTDASYRDFVLKRYFVEDVILYTKNGSHLANFSWERTESADSLENLLSTITGKLVSTTGAEQFAIEIKDLLSYRVGERLLEEDGYLIYEFELPSNYSASARDILSIVLAKTNTLSVEDYNQSILDSYGVVESLEDSLQTREHGGNKTQFISLTDQQVYVGRRIALEVISEKGERDLITLTINDFNAKPWRWLGELLSQAGEQLDYLEYQGTITSTWNNYLTSTDGQDYEYNLFLLAENGAGEGSTISLNLIEEFFKISDYSDMRFIDASTTQFISLGHIAKKYHDSVISLEVYDFNGELVDTVNYQLSKYDSKSWRWLSHLVKKAGDQLDYLEHQGGVASTWNNYLISNNGQSYTYQLSFDSSIAQLDLNSEFIDLSDSYYKAVTQLNKAKIQFYAHKAHPIEYSNLVEFEIFNSDGDLVESVEVTMNKQNNQRWRWLGHVLKNVAEQVDYLNYKGSSGSWYNNFLLSIDGNNYSYNINIVNAYKDIELSNYAHIYNVDLVDLSSVELGGLLKINLSYGDGSKEELFYNPSSKDLENEQIFKENLLNFIAKYQESIVYVDNGLYTNTSNYLYSKYSLSLSLDLESQVNLYELKNEYSSLIQKDDRITFLSRKDLEEGYRVELEVSSESLDEPMSFIREIDAFNAKGWRWFSYFAREIAEELPHYFTAHHVGSWYRTYLENHTQEQFNINYKIYDSNGDFLAGNGVSYDLAERENTLFDIRNRELNYELDVDSIIAEYEVNAVNQYTIIDFVDGEEISLTYDNAGNLLYDGKNHYDWDARNRLTSAERVDGLIKWDYTYDDQNRRVAIETFTRESTEDNFLSEDLTKFIYNNWLLIAETDANGNVTREYSYSDDANGDAGVGKLIKFTDYTDKTGGLLSAESKNYFVINDNVGNITSVIDREGNIINSYAYSPFGELIVEQEQVKLNIGFNTKYEDESGLIYYNNRYYDSELGRFISQDPIFEEGGVNLYNFVENDPINHWDILGYLKINTAYTTESAANSLLNGIDYIYLESNISVDSFNYMVYEPGYWDNESATIIAQEYVAKNNLTNILGTISIVQELTTFLINPRNLGARIFEFIRDRIMDLPGSISETKATEFVENHALVLFFGGKNAPSPTTRRNSHSVRALQTYTSSDFVEFTSVEEKVFTNSDNDSYKGYSATGLSKSGTALGTQSNALIFNPLWNVNFSHLSIKNSQFDWVQDTYFIGTLPPPDREDDVMLNL